MESESSEGGESEGGESEGSESEGGETDATDEVVVVTPDPVDGEGDDDEDESGEVCISSCTAPTEYEWCCEAYNTEKWCHKGFRKLKRKTEPSDGGGETPGVGSVDTPDG
jgi:hypothetical protein